MSEPDDLLPPGPGEVGPVEYPIDGVLDLHMFRPQDVKEVLLEYIEASREKGILKFRIIHGKGIGQLRQTVHTLLARHPGVVAYVLAGEAMGGWGATIVTLRPANPVPELPTLPQSSGGPSRG